MTSGDRTEEQVRQRAYQFLLQRGGPTGQPLDDWLQAGDDLIQVIGGKIVDLAPTDTKKTVREPNIQPNEPGSFAWFWACSSSFADESLMAYRPSDSQSSSREDRMAA